jgi:hypothetical protein
VTTRSTLFFGGLLSSNPQVLFATPPGLVAVVKSVYAQRLAGTGTHFFTVDVSSADETAAAPLAFNGTLAVGVPVAWTGYVVVPNGFVILSATDDTPSHCAVFVSGALLPAP